jgi:hypothetical protein
MKISMSYGYQATTLSPTFLLANNTWICLLKVLMLVWALDCA